MMNDYTQENETEFYEENRSQTPNLCQVCLYLRPEEQRLSIKHFFNGLMRAQEVPGIIYIARPT